MNHDDPDRAEFDELQWLKHSQRLDVDGQIGAILDRRAAEAEAFEKLTRPLAAPRRLRVAYPDTGPLAERLEGANRVRIGQGDVPGTARDLG